MEHLHRYQKIIGNYQLLQPIGKGTFGKVYKAIHLPTNCSVAIKMLNKQLINQDGDFERVSRQIKILRKIRHRHVIQLYEVIETTTHLYLVTELASHDLFSEIVKKKKIDQEQAGKYFKQLILGLRYCLQNNICHRDIKPQNILISNGQLKITDFGLSNVFGSELLRTACGSPSYAPPEMLEKKFYDPRLVDVWSSGVTLYVMVFGILPFEDDSIAKLYTKIKKGNFVVYDTVSQELKELFRSILQIDPKKRTPIEEILESTWIRKFSQGDYSESEIDLTIFQKVCSIYQIDSELLKRDLQSNRHNNRTTTYYLSLKASKIGRDIRKNSQDNSLHSTDSSTKMFIQSLSKSHVFEGCKEPQVLQNVSIDTYAEESISNDIPLGVISQLTIPYSNQKQNNSPNSAKISTNNSAIKIDDDSNDIVFSQQDMVPRRAPKSIKQTQLPVSSIFIPAIRRVSRMKPQFMKRTATKLNQRSISITRSIQHKSIQTKSIGFTKNSISNNNNKKDNDVKLVEINVRKKTSVMSSKMLFVGNENELRRIIGEIEGRQRVVEYHRVSDQVLLISYFTGNINKLIQLIAIHNETHLIS